jgi:hypothetical protein
MKKTYVLKYRTGWGEKIEMEYKAYDINTALLIARNYCRANFISIGRVVSPKGREYIV